jgi:hypothetical protein
LELIDASSSPPKKKIQTYIRKKTVFVEKAIFSCENIPSVEEDLDVILDEIEEEFPLNPSTRHKTRRESQESKKEKREKRNLEDSFILWRKDEIPEISIPKPKDLGKDKKSKSTKGSKVSFQTKSDPVKAKTSSEAMCWSSTTCFKLALGNLIKNKEYLLLITQRLHCIQSIFTKFSNYVIIHHLKDLPSMFQKNTSFYDVSLLEIAKRLHNVAKYKKEMDDKKFPKEHCQRVKNGTQELWRKYYDMTTCFRYDEEAPEGFKHNGEKDPSKKKKKIHYFGQFFIFLLIGRRDVST